jgi:hypothetical protein
MKKLKKCKDYVNIAWKVFHSAVTSSLAFCIFDAKNPPQEHDIYATVKIGI